VAIVRPDGTRCLAANIGAARGFNTENFVCVADMMDLIDRTRILYVEGFFASHSPDVAMAALSRGHSRGGLVRVVSLSAQYICLQSHSLLRYRAALMIFYLIRIRKEEDVSKSFSLFALSSVWEGSASGDSMAAKPWLGHLSSSNMKEDLGALYSGSSSFVN